MFYSTKTKWVESFAERPPTNPKTVLKRTNESARTRHRQNVYPRGLPFDAVRDWTDDARDHARVVLTRMLLEVNPQTVFRTRLSFDGKRLHLEDGSSVNLRPAGKLRLLAIGKAAGGMAAHAQPWGPFDEAVVIARHDAGIPEMECMVSDHPTPTQRSVDAGERALALARATGPDDVLLVLLSGGASALAEAPVIPLAELQQITKQLLASGAPIHEINTVRRHLSRLKGGGLLREARGRVVLLAISDVSGDKLEDIGSGPASVDPTTVDDARAIAIKHDLPEGLPFIETAKKGAAFARVIASNEDALRAGAAAAESLGYATRVMPEWLRGEARDRGRALARFAREAQGSLAIIAGGETTVRVQGSGMGGRNQEVALAAVDGLSSLDAVLACLGTDGVDGPTDAAGAIVDGRTRARSEALGHDAEHFLQENDAYRYFDALDDLVRTGPTGTNVRDVAVLLVKG